MSFESIRPERNNAGPKNETQAYVEMGGSFVSEDNPIEYKPGNVYESLRNKATLEAAIIPDELKADPSTTFASAEQVIQVPGNSVVEVSEVTSNAEKSFMDKVRSWFKSGAVDNRTLTERVAEDEAAEIDRILQSVRDRLETNPESLTRQEVAMLSDEEMTRFVKWKTRQNNLVQ